MGQAPFTFYEFFAGGGMARMGLGEGWACAFANDFDKLKAATYRANFPDAADHFVEGDVWKVSLAQLHGQADLAWASSPCQDFSLAGARAGLTGGRSSAFFGFWGLVEALNASARAPRTIVIENVVGLLTSHKGDDFAALCGALSAQGYRFGAVEIDAARFVPQSRPRVFVVATKVDVPVDLTALEPALPFHSKRVVASYEHLEPKLQERWIWWRMSYPPANNETLDAILEPDDQVDWFSEEKAKKFINLLSVKHAGKLKAAKARKTRTVGTLFRRMRLEDGQKVQRGELRFDGVAGCLRTPGGGSSKQVVVVVTGNKVRVRDLTPREAARLMGMDEDYVLPARKGAALKICGDGVVVDVVAWLRDEILNRLADLDTGADGAEKERRRPRSHRA